MAPFERLGDFLLLKKLAQDPLGETFRAARAGSRGIEQLLLLRVFNGVGIPADELGRHLEENAAAGVPDSPFIAQPVDKGVAGRSCYLAFDYLSAKNLAQLRQAADDQMNPLPADQGLLITDRLTQALAAARRAGLNHGFLVPELALVSNEGEVRLLGFEVGEALRRLIPGGMAGPHFAHYLSPEARSGQPLAPSDDVYSLGALLFELLTGQQPPTDIHQDPATTLRRSHLADEYVPLPDELVDLLARSLIPAERRLPDIPAWQQALVEAITSTGYQGSPFNLAVFMHNLLQDEINEEQKEIAREKAGKAPTPPAPPAETPAVEPSLTGPSAAEAPSEPPPSRSPSKVPMIAIATAAALAVAVGVYFLLVAGGREAGEEPPAPTPAAEAAPPPTPTETAPKEPAAIDEAALQAEIERLLAEKEKAIAGEYEKRLAGLYDELAKVQQTEVATTPRKREKPSPAAQAPPAVPGDRSAAVAPPSSPPPATGAPSAAPSPPAEITRDAEPGEAPPASAAPSPAPQEPQPTPAPTRAPSPTPPPATPAPRKTSQPPPAEHISAGPEISPPKLLSFEPPPYPPIARKLRVQGKVILRVLVDQSGKVKKVEFLQKVSRDVGINEAAERAARRARFRPATRNGVAVEAWYTLVMPFNL